MQPQDAAIGHALPWLEDETLYSWCSRYHRLAVNGLASATCEQLFGARRLGVAHDLPAGIAEFALRSNGSLGTVAEIIQARTVLPFYLPFKDPALGAEAQRLMASGGIGSLKYQLGLLTSGLGAAHPLKACPKCLLSDLKDAQVAYWHRAHQLPSVWLCHVHDEPLWVSGVKLDQMARFQWCLPAQSGLRSFVGGTSVLPDERSMAVWRRMAEFGLRLVNEPPGRLTAPAKIAGAFRAGLARQGCIKHGARVSWGPLEDSLTLHAVAMAALPPMAMQVDLSSARSQLTRILDARTLTHPLRYTAWIAWLFETWDEFLSAYDRPLEVQQPRVVARSPAAPEHDPRAEPAVLALLSGTESATAIARRLGLSVSTIAAWAAKGGLMPRRRPKVLTEPLWLTAIEMLAEGSSKAAVAKRCDISEVSVTRILRSVPELQAEWHRVRQKAARDKNRSAWLGVASAGGALGPAALRRLEPATYAWLYRNDRAWLLEHSHITPPTAWGNHADARRRRADARYAHHLRAALSSSAEAGGLNLSRPDLWVIHAPGLKRVLKAPQSWPLTVAVIRTAMVATFDDGAPSLI